MSEPNPPSYDLPALNRGQVLGILAATALVLLFVARLWSALGNVKQIPSSFTSQALLLGIGLGLLIALASALLYQLCPPYRQSAGLYLEYILKPLSLVDIPWLGILPGLSEELLFRGVILPALGAGSVGLVLSSIGFGLLHMVDLKQWPYMLWATLVGGALGYSVLVSQNLLIAVVAHTVANVLSSLWWKLGLSPLVKP